MEFEIIKRVVSCLQGWQAAVVHFLNGVGRAFEIIGRSSNQHTIWLKTMKKEVEICPKEPIIVARIPQHCDPSEW